MPSYNLIQVTANQCARLAESLSRSLATLNVRVNPSSDIARMQSEMEWLGSFDSSADQPASAHAVDSQRALSAFPLVEQAQRIAATLEHCASLSGMPKKAPILSSRLDRLRTQGAAAQDTLFELEVAAKLLRKGLKVELDEPDIRIVMPGGRRIGLACKRPRTAKKWPARIRDACTQIERSNHPGVVLIGIEPVLHEPSLAGLPTSYHCETPEELEAYMLSRVDAAMRQRPMLQTVSRLREAAEDAWGVLFCGRATALCKSPPSYVYVWIRRTIEFVGAPGGVESVDQWIFGRP